MQLRRPALDEYNKCTYCSGSVLGSSSCRGCRLRWCPGQAGLSEWSGPGNAMKWRRAERVQMPCGAHALCEGTPADSSMCVRPCRNEGPLFPYFQVFKRSWTCRFSSEMSAKALSSPVKHGFDLRRHYEKYCLWPAFLSRGNPGSGEGMFSLGYPFFFCSSSVLMFFLGPPICNSIVNFSSDTTNTDGCGCKNH